MTNATETIQDCYRILHGNPGIFKSISVQKKLDALNMLGAAGTLRDVGLVASIAFSKNDELASKAAEIAAYLLGKHPPFTAWNRLHAESEYGGYYADVKADELDGLTRFPKKHSVHLLGFFSLNSNGYVREKAVSLLGKTQRPEMLPYLLKRCNDWVPQVRERAAEVLLENLNNFPASMVVKHHSFIEALARAKRTDHTTLRQKLFAYLSSQQVRDSLFKAMPDFSLPEKFFCWKALRTSMAREPELIDVAMKDRAPEIRQLAAREIMPEDTARLSPMLNDRSPRVRNAALRVAASKKPADKNIFEAALTDDFRPSREFARFVLAAEGFASFAAFYRENLVKSGLSSQPLGLISGFCELAEPQDISILLDLMPYPNAKIRLSALSALNRLDAPQAKPFYIRGLQDKNSRIRALCVSILSEKHPELHDEIRQLLNAGNAATQKAVLRILFDLNPLKALRDIMVAISHFKPDLAPLAWLYFRRWHSRYRIKLWFSFSDSVYTEVRQLFFNLKTSRNIPPEYASMMKDMEIILDLLKKNRT